MNRTTANLTAALLLPMLSALAQEPAKKPASNAQDPAVAGLLAAVQKAEAALRSVRLKMTTTGTLPGGPKVATRGELRVLRGAQPKDPGKLYSQLEYSFGDGLRGRMVSARTADGIEIFEEDPAFGAAFLHIKPLVVTDLEWAGEVLQRSDLPGMADGRADSPLGSGLILDLLGGFELEVEAGAERNGAKGSWLRGSRKREIGSADGDVPLWDSVEMFVRDQDHAVVSARYLVGKEVVQEIVVEELTIDPKLPADAFVVDGNGLRRRDVRDHTPMWQQIEQVILRAEAKTADDVVRPSQRK